jgi:hypothetical protein
MFYNHLMIENKKKIIFVTCVIKLEKVCGLYLHLALTNLWRDFPPNLNCKIAFVVNKTNKVQEERIILIKRTFLENKPLPVTSVTGEGRNVFLKIY